MNINMAMHSQLSTIESKKQTQKTSRTETESRSFGGFSVGRGKREDGGKDAGIKKYKLVGTE